MEEVKQEAQIEASQSEEAKQVEEKIKQVQQEITDLLERHNVYIEIMPTYNLIIKPRAK